MEDTVRSRPDISIESLNNLDLFKIKRLFRIPKQARMTRTKLLEKVKPLCGTGKTVPQDQQSYLMLKSIHELRKLAGFRTLEKGYKKQDYIEVILGGR